MTRPYPVTSRQGDVLRFIVGFQEANDGVSPTHEVMRAGLGFASKSGVCRVLDKLEERGCITRLKGRNQAIKVLAPVSVPRAPDGAPLYVVPLALGGAV